MYHIRRGRYGAATEAVGVTPPTDVIAGTDGAARTDEVARTEGSGAVSTAYRTPLLQLLECTDSRDVNRGHGPGGSAADPFLERPWAIQEPVGSWSGPRLFGGDA